MLTVPGIEPFFAPCESRLEGDGWTIIQRRLDGRVSFDRSWQEYRDGFGDLRGEFFLGLQKIHKMTQAQPHELYIYLQNFKYATKTAYYSNFTIGSEQQGFELSHLIYGKMYCTLDDSVMTNRCIKFTTYDRDNDNHYWGNCAKEFGGGWWHNAPFVQPFSNLNGQVNKQLDCRKSMKGIVWDNEQFKSSIMMIRPEIKNL
ncbi:maker579 [Drosophila busckii]|uniref:Maker579 n=1 Tax=Drosophila busckii TaxID=30019 RepID=A0A0M4ES25_DROBS|nr:maker579 [Drosophila busckii]